MVGKRNKALGHAVAGVAFLWIAHVNGALAAAQRTFVASNGNDANPCSLAQPCRSFAAAIGKTVPAGEVIVLDSAGYGTVTINQSVSIIAPSGIYAGISVSSGQNGVTVAGGPVVVVLRGLSIIGLAGSQSGILFNQGQRLRVENCVISGLGSTGIVQYAPGSEMVVIDTIVRDNAGYGINVDQDATAVIDHVRIERNAGYGVHVHAQASRAVATIRNSVVSYNRLSGVYANTGTLYAETVVTVEDSILSNNADAGVLAGGSDNGGVRTSLRRNSIVGNTQAIWALIQSNDGFSFVQADDNTLTGNHDFPTSLTASLADGEGAIIRLSNNQIDGGWLEGRNGGLHVTYKNNSGLGSFLGSFTSELPY